MSMKDEAILTGTEKPQNIPSDWKGEPHLDGKGWLWFDPADRGNCVRIYRRDQDALNPVDRDTYVVVTVVTHWSAHFLLLSAAKALSLRHWSKQAQPI